MKTLFTHLGPFYIREVYLSWDGPRLCSCLSPSGHLHLAYWVSDHDDGETWFFVPISPERLNQVASGDIPLRAAFTLPEGDVLWDVFIPYDDRNPLGTLRLGSELPPDVLPDDDVHLDYAPPSFLPTLKFGPDAASATQLREIVDLALDTGASKELAAEHLGSVLTRFQSVTTCLTVPEALTGPFSLEAKRISAMNAMMLFDGSFGIRLGSAISQPNIMGDESPLAPALRLLIALLEAGDDGAALHSLVPKVRGRTVAHYVAFLKTLRHGGTGIRVAWGSPGRVVRTVDLTLPKIRSTLQVLTKTDENLRTIREVEGQLVSYDTEKRHRRKFKLVSDDKVLYRGDVADELPLALVVESHVVAKIEEKWEVNPTTGRETVTYRLVNITIQND